MTPPAPTPAHPPAVQSTRPVLLLPPAKGKVPGGDGPAYRATLTDDHPLTAARREVLAAAVAAAAALDDAALARVAGVRGADVDRARALLADLPDAPTLPVGIRTAGIVHRNAGLAEVAGRADALPAEVLLVSGLLGIAGLAEPMPDHRLELAVSLAPLGGLATFWRRALAEHLATRLADRPVVDLLPAEHARAIDPSLRARGGWTSVVFRRPDGRAANAARTKVAKGVLVAALLAPARLTAAEVTAPALAARIDLGEGWSLKAATEDTLVATYRG
ncbi:MAG: peroxide stress protein YaaA [Nitriliruptoraceae bacterium]